MFYFIGPHITSVQQALIEGAEQTANKGQPDGYAPLGLDQKIDIAYIPAALVGAVKFKGTWNATTNVITSSDVNINGDPMPSSSSSNEGWYFIIATAGTTSIDGISDWNIPDIIISDGADWQKIDNSDKVLTVNMVPPINGDITLTKSDIGLGNVDNTSDANKPVSTAQQTALDLKVDETITVNGQALSGNVSLTTNDISENTNLYYTNERVDDRVAALIQNGTGITWVYDDNLNTLTPTVTVTGYTDEMAQDAVGGILTDSAEIDFTYNDAGPSITASIVASSIDETKLDASVNASLDLADISVSKAAATEVHVYTTADLPAISTPAFGTYTLQCYVLNPNVTYIIHNFIDVANPIYTAGAIIKGASSQWWTGFRFTGATDALIVNPGLDGYLDTDIEGVWLESSTARPIYKAANCSIRAVDVYHNLTNASATSFGTLDATAGDCNFFSTRGGFTSAVQTGLPFICTSTSTYKMRIIVQNFDSRDFMPYYCNKTTTLGSTTVINGITITHTYNQVSPRFDISGVQAGGAVIKISDSQFFMRANIGGTAYDSAKYIIYTNNTAGKVSNSSVSNCSMVTSSTNAQLGSATVTGLTYTNFMDITSYWRQAGISFKGNANIPNGNVIGIATGKSTATATATTTYALIAISGGTNNALHAQSNLNFGINAITGFPFIEWIGTETMDIDIEVDAGYLTTFNAQNEYYFGLLHNTNHGNVSNTGTLVGESRASGSYNSIPSTVTIKGFASMATNDTISVQVKQPASTLRAVGLTYYTITLKAAN